AGTGGRLARQQTFPLRFLACELACASDRLGLFAHAPFGGLFVVVTKLHLTKDALALHLLLQRLEGLIDVIVANLYQQAGPSSDCLGTIETHTHARARGLAPRARCGFYQSATALSTGRARGALALRAPRGQPPARPEGLRRVTWPILRPLRASRLP